MGALATPTPKLDRSIQSLCGDKFVVVYVQTGWAVCRAWLRIYDGNVGDCIGVKLDCTNLKYKRNHISSNKKKYTINNFGRD